MSRPFYCLTFSKVPIPCRGWHKRFQIVFNGLNLSVMAFVIVCLSKVIWAFTLSYKETWGQFHQHFTSSFYMHRSQKRKKTVRSSNFLHFWDLLPKKLLVNTLMKLTLGGNNNIQEERLECKIQEVSYQEVYNKVRPFSERLNTEPS